MTTAVQVVGDKAVVLGMDGQLYVKSGNSWIQDDVGIAGVSPDFRGKRSAARKKTAWLRSYTKSSSAEFTCGNFDLQFPAFFWREANSHAWTWSDIGEAISVDRIRLNDMCFSNDELYIATSLGVVLRRLNNGAINACNDVAATSQLSTLPAELAGARLYNRELYFGGGGGLFRLSQGKLKPVFGPPSLPIYADERPTSSILGRNLQVANDRLWVFGGDSISRLVGSQWERIPIPALYGP